MKKVLSIFYLYTLLAISANADNDLEFGKAAADEYVLNKKTNKLTNPDGRIIGMYVGHDFESEARNWMDESNEAVGKIQYGLFYGDKLNFKFISFLWRSTIHFFKLNNGVRPLSFSVLPTMIFPSLQSSVPVYLGFSGGLGYVFRQTYETSMLSVDMNVFSGFRMMDLMESFGFFTEVGWQNKILLLSKARYSSAYARFGVVTNF